MFCQKCGTQNPNDGKFCRNCGSDLAILPAQQVTNLTPADYYIDTKGRFRPNYPEDLLSTGLRKTISGLGFLIISIVLLITHVAGGQAWWWAMLFPAFSLIAGGIGNIAKAKRLEKKKMFNEIPAQPVLFNSTNASLPAAEQIPVNYNQPPQKSIYDTGEFIVPPSVTENTTRHLEINKEGETMALPEEESWKIDRNK